MILLLHACIDLFAVLQILKSAECNPTEIIARKWCFQPNYLFDSSSSLRYWTVNCRILCPKLLWFQGGHAVDELLAISRDASRSCPLRKLRHLSNSPEEGIQKLPPFTAEGEWEGDANGIPPWTFLCGNWTCFQGEHDRFHYVLHRHWKKLQLQWSNPRV